MEKKLNMLVRQGGLFLLVMSVAVFGCHGGGGGGGVAAPSGTVTQGEVSGAVVFADHLAGAEANQKIDADEVDTSTMSDANGNFILPKIPGYDYSLVSQGGTDSLTGLPAMLMFAPTGVGNVTPLTTMVALTPNAKDKIESLGVHYDVDLSKTVTPAALLLVQSTSSIVAAVTAALNPGGNKLSISSIDDIQKSLMTQIANEVAISSSLTNTTLLTPALITAVTKALDSILVGHPNITLIAPATTTQVAQNIVGPIVNTVANAIVASTGSASFSATNTVPESTIITAGSVSNILSTHASVLGIVAPEVSITSDNSALVVSGSPGTTAIVGTPYTFTPAVSDSAGAILLFSITSKPAWASFNNATGELSGTPATTNIGTTSEIVISVSDGIETKSLPAFSITVTNPTGVTGGTGS